MKIVFPNSNKYQSVVFFVIAFVSGDSDFRSLTVLKQSKLKNKVNQ